MLLLRSAQGVQDEECERGRKGGGGAGGEGGGGAGVEEEDTQDDEGGVKRSERRGMGERILDERAIMELPWGVVVLLGGGFALAEASKVSFTHVVGLFYSCSRWGGGCFG